MVVNKEDVYCGNGIFLKKRKKTNTICVRKVKNRAFSLQLAVFGKWSFFGALSVSPNTTKIGASAGTGENPKWHFWSRKCHFGKGPRKGLYYLWYLNEVLCWKHYFYSVFSETQLCRNKRAQLEKNKNYQKWGVFAKMQKGAFLFVYFYCFGGFVFSLCLIFCLEKKSKKANFLQFQCLFSFFVSPKGLSFKILLFFLFCFRSWFFLCFPFQNSIFSLLFVHQPLFGKHFWIIYLSFSCLFLS